LRKVESVKGFDAEIHKYYFSKGNARVLLTDSVRGSFLTSDSGLVSWRAAVVANGLGEGSGIEPLSHRSVGEGQRLIRDEVWAL
jgi:hypothetical protein